MASYPPNPLPIPPPYGFDPREQRKRMKEQVRDQRGAYKAQREAFKAERNFRRRQFRGFRRRSLLGPILLIAIGVALLLVRNGHVSAAQAVELYGRWWPLLFVFAAVVMLLEWAFDRSMASLHPDTPPLGPRHVGAGVVVLLVLLALAGPSSRAMQNHAQMMLMDFGADNDTVARFLGEKHEADQVLDETLPPGAIFSLDNPHGDVTVNGGGQDGQIHLTLHKEVYSSSDSEAGRKMQQLAPRITSAGGQVTIAVPSFEGANADLTVTLPDVTATNITASRGDVRVNGIKAPVNVTSNHGDVELSEIAGDVNVRINRRDSSVSAHNIIGGVSLKGHAQDLNLSDISGQVSVEGDFYGTTHLEQVRGALRFRTSRTDLQVARLDGEVEVSPDASLSIDGAAGPSVLTTRDRNITLGHMSGDISVTNTNGTVDVTSAPPLGDLTIQNRHGSVNITVPDGLGLTIEAETSDGSLQNEFGLTSNENGHHTSLAGTIGRGGPRVKVITTHGDIDLRKAEIPPLTPKPVAPTTPLPSGPLRREPVTPRPNLRPDV